MKILYFGTVCNTENYSELLSKCKNKPSISTIVFETSLLGGLKQNSMDVEIHSFPMFPYFPSCKTLWFGKKTETISCGYKCCWLKTLNLPFLKQISRRLNARRIIKRWMKENVKDGVVMTYSIPPFIVKDIVRLSKRFGVKTVAIVPDLLRDMYINENNIGFVAWLKQKYLDSAIKLQDKYDGYVYLTEAMSKVVAPGKPYVVMEGITDITDLSLSVVEKITPRVIMYAGMLHEKYGIINLLDAFEKQRFTDAELWLFGQGTAVPEIKKRAINDKRIKFFGVVPREKILEYESAATLLVNPRSVYEEFTKYSFPSKTTEYMLSGTPLLTTKLEGIPNEYFDHCFSVNDNSVDELAKAIESALSCSKSELNEIGYRARNFIISEKNAKKQSLKVINFVEEIVYDSTPER